MSKKREPQVIIPLSEYERLSRFSDVYGSLMKDADGLKDERETYRRYLEAVHEAVDIGGGIGCQKALLDKIRALKSDAENWRRMIHSPIGVDLNTMTVLITYEALEDLKADAEKWRTFDKLAFGGDVTHCIGDVIQMREDAKLGALVRQMPPSSELKHKAGIWEAQACGHSAGRDTPEEALRAALEK